MTLLRYAPLWFAKYTAKYVGRASLRILQAMLPDFIHRRLQAQRPDLAPYPAIGLVCFGELRQVTPISRDFGFARGLPIDRYYIEGFLARHASDIKGRVLEIGDNIYTRKFGGDRVDKSDVLHVSEENPLATFVGDLSNADHIPSSLFDCVILTQTLHLIYDVRAALATLYRILKPGGILLATFPGISQIDQGEWGNTWYWGFTALSARRLFEEVFPASKVAIETYGNVLTAVAFLHGLAVKEMRKEELDYHDPDYQLLITARAIKPR
jgi:SAM-dependent methyltransferase